MVGTVKKSIETELRDWFSRKVAKSGDGGCGSSRTLLFVTRYDRRAMPSLRHSPWMRGAPNGISPGHLRIRSEFVK